MHFSRDDLKCSEVTRTVDEVNLEFGLWSFPIFEVRSFRIESEHDKHGYQCHAHREKARLLTSDWNVWVFRFVCALTICVRVIWVYRQASSGGSQIWIRKKSIVYYQRIGTWRYEWCPTFVEIIWVEIHRYQGYNSSARNPSNIRKAIFVCR